MNHTIRIVIAAIRTGGGVAVGYARALHTLARDSSFHTSREARRCVSRPSTVAPDSDDSRQQAMSRMPPPGGSVAVQWSRILRRLPALSPDEGEHLQAVPSEGGSSLFDGLAWDTDWFRAPSLPTSAATSTFTLVTINLFPSSHLHRDTDIILVTPHGIPVPHLSSHVAIRPHRPRCAANACI